MKDNSPKLGQLITGEAFRDAIHIAIAPVVARGVIASGAHIGLDDNGLATQHTDEPIGVADPFLQRTIQKGESFYLFLYPGTITGLRHEWAHPAFPSAQSQPKVATAQNSESKEWMTRWALEHVAEDYYSDHKRSPEEALAYAIRAGHNMSVGPHENARDYIDGEWWTHWEFLTGEKGQRDESFSCGC